jgi:hypothetical protein
MLRSSQSSRREAKKDSTRRAIVETAVRLFAKHGFEGVTVEELAVAKEDIVVAFMLGVEEQIQRQASRLARSTRPGAMRTASVTPFLEGAVNPVGVIG